MFIDNSYSHSFQTHQFIQNNKSGRSSDTTRFPLLSLTKGVELQLCLRVGCGWPLVPPLPDGSVTEIVSSCCVTPQLPKSFTNLDGLMKIRNIETHSCLSTVYQYNEIGWLLLGCDECKLDVFCLPCIGFLRQRKGRQSMQKITPELSDMPSKSQRVTSLKN